MPIGVVILADPIDEVDPMPNCTLTMPCVVVLSCTPVSSLWNAKNWPYPARAFGCSCINHYTYKVVCSIAGRGYGCIVGKGILVGHERCCIIYGCDRMAEGFIS